MAGSSDMIHASIDGVEMKVSRSFYRGEHTTFRPVAQGMRQPGALAKHVLAGWMPPEPFIDKDTTIVAFGSCFASNVSAYLNNLGFNVASQRKGKAYITEMGDGIVNSYAIRQQFEWGWEGRTPEIPLWHGYKAEEFGYEAEVQAATKALFDAADVFIITLGLSEIWYDEPTGEVFWRAVPEAHFDPARHKFRVASVAENKGNLRAVYDLIRRHRPHASIIFTVSPVPLSATFRPISSYTANSVSKASLRCAVDELIQEIGPDDRLFYFPSYEVVLDCFHFPFKEDLRHPHPHILHANMTAFERYFCATGLTDADVEIAWLDALAEDRRAAEMTPEERERLEDEQEAWQIANPAASIRRDLAMRQRQAALDDREAEKAARIAERDARIAAREARLQARQQAG